MKKTTKLGLSVVAAALVSIGSYLGYSYIKEQSRIDQIANQLRILRGQSDTWSHTYKFDLPSTPVVGDWHNEDLKVPQILFTVPNDDKSKISIWAAGIDGTGLELLIPEGEVGLTPHVTFGTSADYSRFISRSPNGRYVLVPQKGGLVLYDLKTKEKTFIKGVSQSATRVLWHPDSSQVVISHSDSLIKVMLPSKQVTTLDDTYGDIAGMALEGDWTNKVLSRKDNRLYVQLERNGGGWFSCRGSYVVDNFEPDIKTCGNTLVIDLDSLKIVDYGDYIPDEYQCRPNGSWMGDAFNCGSDIYIPGIPAKHVGNASVTLNPVLVHYNPKESWFLSTAFSSLARYTPNATKTSPVVKMGYNYRYFKNGEWEIIKDMGLSFSRYVIEHIDDNNWSQYLYPPVSYEDLNKAKARLKEQGYDY
ncbi:hypothetical protein ACFSJQ_06910 [Vibrio olivae]|uniref:WD40 repeat domain-containing protein n=1 Tax=Vibrio olivae TaxID=1243002 RepID=A0ABV5HIP1_9VIBR